MCDLYMVKDTDPWIVTDALMQCLTNAGRKVGSPGAMGAPQTVPD